MNTPVTHRYEGLPACVADGEVGDGGPLNAFRPLFRQRALRAFGVDYMHTVSAFGYRSRVQYADTIAQSGSAQDVALV